MIGCGFGDDADEVARPGFCVTAIDIALTAIKMCVERFPHSQARYEVADLFALPSSWRDGFDFVLEYFNVQSLPPHVQPRALHAIANLVVADGVLLLIGLGGEASKLKAGPPWPLRYFDLAKMERYGLHKVGFEAANVAGEEPDIQRLRIVYQMQGRAVKRPLFTTDYAPDQIEARWQPFLRAYPDFAETSQLDVLCQREYGRLDENNHVYLDYTGDSLYGMGQLKAHSALLKSGSYGNPHSHNIASAGARAGLFLRFGG